MPDQGGHDIAGRLGRVVHYEDTSERKQYDMPA